VRSAGTSVARARIAARCSALRTWRSCSRWRSRTCCTSLRARSRLFHSASSESATNRFSGSTCMYRRRARSASYCARATWRSVDCRTYRPAVRARWVACTLGDVSGVRRGPPARRGAPSPPGARRPRRGAQPGGGRRWAASPGWAGAARRATPCSPPPTRPAPAAVAVQRLPAQGFVAGLRGGGVQGGRATQGRFFSRCSCRARLRGCTLSWNC
jgi:hypothetical protein